MDLMRHAVNPVTQEQRDHDHENPPPGPSDGDVFSKPNARRGESFPK